MLSKEISNSLVKKQIDFEELQEKSFTVVAGLPAEWSADEMRKRVLDIASKSKLRVLNPAVDVLVKDRLALICFDSVAALNLEEVAQEKKKEEEEIEKKRVQDLLDAGKEVAPEPPALPVHPDVWDCPSCTLQNPWEAEVCEICESPKPENIPLVVPGSNLPEEGKESGDEEAALPLSIVLEDEREEEAKKYAVFAENLKASAREFYEEIKATIVKKLDVLSESIESEKKDFAAIETKLEEEIARKEAKESRKKAAVNANRKRQPPPPKQSTAVDSTLVVEQPLVVTVAQLKINLSAAREKSKSTCEGLE